MLVKLKGFRLNTLKGDVVKNYLKKFPDTPTLTLAKMIYKNNKTLYTNVDNVRDVIRYHRGAHGEANKAKLTDKTFVKVGKLNPFDNLPEGLTDYQSFKPVEIDSDRTLILTDAHVPYHDKTALSIALQYGLDNGADTVLLMGDFWDCYNVSMWVKDPRKRDFAGELSDVKEVLGIIRDAFAKAKIIYKLGNHEDRLERYLKVKAPELLGYEALDFKNIIEADKFDAQVVGDNRPLKIGRLFCVHGHEFGGSINNPVNPARGLFLRGNEISCCGHHHQTSQHTSKNLAELITSCWSIGCLSDLHPEYRPINNWNHGFAFLTHGKEGFRFENKRIIKGEIY